MRGFRFGKRKIDFLASSWNLPPRRGLQHDVTDVSTSTSSCNTSQKNQDHSPSLDKFKQTFRKYGFTAAAFHSSVYVATITACFSAVHIGVDVQGGLDTIANSLPNWPFSEGADSATPTSDIEVVKVESTSKPAMFGLSAELYSEILIAYIATAATGPLRGVLTVLGTPYIANLMERTFSLRADRGNTPTRNDQPEQQLDDCDGDVKR
mmetsp:Transcript_36459/g.71586  ORF Transcript_36459/g.71586 Transcript_36459/m.71586 type:complete len:208 (-) Transcript_36459:142-765(-)